jgi:ABC-type branched-subunit amino acid transport system ATPase component
MALLEVEHVSVNFGGLKALDGVSLRVHAGEIVSLIGPNGAGKSTMFNCISGLQPLSRGAIRFKDGDVTGAPPHVRSRLGIGRTFQKVQLFGNLSVVDNVLIAAEAAEGDLRVFGSFARSGASRRRERRLRERAMAALDLVGLSGLSSRPAGSLPLGEARRVELARALSSVPDLLLLDEPASGLDEDESAEFGATILDIRRELGVSSLVVEHDVQMVARISDEIYVLDFGVLVAKGRPADVLVEPKVVAAYLGEEISA